MSPRRNRRAGAVRPSRDVAWAQETEEGPDGEWIVRSISAAAAVKTYRCPGCDQEIRPGVPHVVAWRVDDRDGEDRRHWHSPCWRARDRRAPRIMRSRGAPRY